MADYHPLNVALSLSVVRGEKWYPSGTGVVLAHNLAVTAKHVIQDYLNRFGHRTSGAGVQYLDADVLAFHCSGPNSGTFLQVPKIWPSPFTDIAFLQLNTRFNRRLVLDLNLPSEGDEVSAFGFHQSTSTILSSTREPLPEDIRKQMNISAESANLVTCQVDEKWDLLKGSVLDVYKDRRNTTEMGNFPSFYVSTKFEHGMSGGPVFNPKGELCGVMSSGMDLENPAEGISLVAALSAGMQTVIDLDYDGSVGKVYPAIQLVENGFLSVG